MLRKIYALTLFSLAVLQLNAQAPASSELRFTFIGRYASNAYDAGGTEIAGYDPASKRLFSVNAVSGDLDIINLTNPFTPVLISSIDLAPYGNSANSVSVKNGVVIAAVENSNKQLNGKAVFFNAATGAFIDSVTVGALPDMCTFTPDGNKVLVCNEGEPNTSYTVDPVGSVSIINVVNLLTTGITQADVTTLDFSIYNSPFPLPASVRIFGVGASVAQDMEPEYVTVSDDSRTAWVTCQENNAMAILNLQTNSWVALKGLGFKDYNIAGNGIDASDQNSGNINIANWPVKGMYQPDGLASFRYNGMMYVVSANEGDVREYSALNEASRVSSRTLDPAAFPNAASLQNNNNIGRLNITNKTGDTDNDGDMDVLYSFGARSFSIWDSSMTQVYDSGDDFEQFFAVNSTANFNCSNTNNTKKNRSDDKGPEPEDVEIATIGDSTYAFIGMERQGGILVYNITNPAAAYFVTYFSTRNFSQTPALNQGGDLAPEGILFIPKAQSPNGRNMLVVSNEVSGTIALYQIDIQLTVNSDVQVDHYVLTDSTLIGTFNGNQYYEGGYSGIHYIPGTANEFFVTTDRGPNLDAGSHPNATGTTLLFPFPSYAPKIHRVKAQGDSIVVLNTTTLKRPGGTNASGVPNPPGSGGTGEAAWSSLAPTLIAPDVWGADPEGIVEGNNNDLYICEEYGPTFSRVNKTTGEIIMRFTPFGASANNLPIDTMVKKRVANRGFEGVAFTPNGKVYAILQSPLANPNAASSDASSLHRLVEYDPATGVTRMYAYAHDEVIGGSNGIRNKDWKIGDLVAVNNHEFLVLEHCERNGFNFKNIYKIDIANATPILAENFSGSTFEQLNTAAAAQANGIIPVQKTLLLDLLESNWDLSHDKPEGITIIDDTTIAVVNDNDYGINSPNADGQVVFTGKTTVIYIYHLPGTMALDLCHPIIAPVASSSAVCTGDTASFTANGGGPGFTYQWTLNNSNITNATSSMYSGSAAGNYAIHITDANGCTAISPAVALTVNPNPAATVIPLGATTFCQGGNVSLMSAMNHPSYSYQWYNNSVAIPGAQNATWTANTSGTYSVNITVNATGCDARSAGVNVIVNPNPIAAYTAAGNMQFCQGDTLWLQAQTGSGYNFQWNNNSSPIIGATDSNLVVTTSGNYWLDVTDANGCSSNSGSPATVTVYPTPSQPVISQTGNVLTSTPAFSYQWVLNGNSIAGETGQSHNAVTGGNYQVIVTNSNGCSAISDTTILLSTGAIAITDGTSLNVFPNPFNDQTTVALSVNAASSVSIELYNMEGQLITNIYNGDCLPGLHKFDMNSTGIAAGVYMMKVKIDDEVKVIRLVRQ
jgi:hypothetical protein